MNTTRHILSSLRTAGTSRVHIHVRSFTSTTPVTSSSALDELSSSIERLAKSRTPPTSSNQPVSGMVHTPRSTTPTRNRQTVSGRAFMNGHYYNPSTLTYTSITQKPPRLARPLLGPTKKQAMQRDLLYVNGLNPARPRLGDDSYKNAAILAGFVTEMGKIMPRSVTGLTRRSQRWVGKAVRRARSMGLLPVMSRGGTRASGAGWK